MELGLKSLSAPRAEQAAALREHLDSLAAALKDKDDTGHIDATFAALTTGYLAARLGETGIVDAVLASDLAEARGRSLRPPGVASRTCS